jgi:hypothetical protein
VGRLWGHLGWWRPGVWGAAFWRRPPPPPHTHTHTAFTLEADNPRPGECAQEALSKRQQLELSDELAAAIHKVCIRVCVCVRVCVWGGGMVNVRWACGGRPSACCG